MNETEAVRSGEATGTFFTGSRNENTNRLGPGTWRELTMTGITLAVDWPDEATGASDDAGGVVGVVLPQAATSSVAARANRRGVRRIERRVAVVAEGRRHVEWARCDPIPEARPRHRRDDGPPRDDRRDRPGDGFGHGLPGLAPVSRPADPADRRLQGVARVDP